MNEEAKIEVPEEKFLDLPEPLRAVAGEYGREMLALVYNSGMVSQALKVMAELSEKHRSVGGLHAVKVLGDAINATANSYAGKMGWTGEELAACQSAIQRAFSQQIVVPGSRIMLQ